MNIKDAAILKSIKTGQTTLLQAIAATVQKLTLEQKAAMDETTYFFLSKNGNNYDLNLVNYIYPTEVSVTDPGDVNQAVHTINTAGSKTISVDGRATLSQFYTLRYNINGGAWVDIATNVSNTSYQTFSVSDVSVSVGDVIIINLMTSASGSPKYAKNGTINKESSLQGHIYSQTLVKDANIGLRYWGDIVANLAAGATGSTIKMKICDSAGTPLHSNFVTINSSEYARIPLERSVALTATSGSQTVWNFTSLTNADAFINELGVLAKALIVELALDGTNYTVLKEVANFNEDISNILAPRITLVSGTGVVSGTSKLRATYIVNIPLSNTTIKLQVQLNRVAVGDTSPSIQPFVGDATKYVSAGQVAII